MFAAVGAATPEAGTTTPVVEPEMIALKPSTQLPDTAAVSAHTKVSFDLRYWLVNKSPYSVASANV